MEPQKAKPRSSDTTTRVTVLESQMDTIQSSVEKLEEKIDNNYATLHHRISDLRDDLRDDIDSKHEKVIQKLEEHNTNSASFNSEMRERINQIEKWKWMIMGGAIVVGYVLAHVKLDNLF